MRKKTIRVRLIRTRSELAQAFAIRREVFIIGQNVDEAIEMDEFDSSATHILALLGDQPVGTARWRKTDQGWKLERFAVLGTFRGQGVGAALLNFVLEALPDHDHVYLNAQTQVIPFYSRFGFVATGPEFEEANIAHRRMVLRNS